MKIVTDTIHPDEPCHGLTEKHEWRGEEYRRIQRVFVVRGDAIAAYETDLGPASMFSHCNDTLIFSMGDDTVGQLMEEAEKDRHDAYWKKVSQELQEASSLIEDVLSYKEENWARIYNQSVFGPSHTKQRNGFPQNVRRYL